MRILRGTKPGTYQQLAAYRAVQADHREDPNIPPMKPLAQHIIECGWDDKFRGSVHRDRKAPRLTARRRSRKFIRDSYQKGA